MAPVTLLLTYDKPVYHGGEVLNGNLQVSFRSALEVQKIKVKVAGKCKVEWSETTGTGSDKREDTYTNSEKYLDQQIVLFNPARPETMGPGDFHYRFIVALPTPLPDTFEEKSGRIFYYCKGSVKTSGTIFNSEHKEKVPFTVQGIVRPDSFENYHMMPTLQKTDELPWLCCCCCCISSGKIVTSLNLDKRVYAPGENIVINAEISNQTTEALSLLKAILKQKVTCISAGGETDVKEHGISSISSLDQVRPHSDYVWSNTILKVPSPLPPTNLGGCKIILVDYNVEVTIGENSGCCAPKQKYKLPIFIATSPYWDTLAHGTAEFGFDFPTAPPAITSQPTYGFSSAVTAPNYM